MKITPKQRYRGMILKADKPICHYCEKIWVFVDRNYLIKRKWLALLKFNIELGWMPTCDCGWKKFKGEEIEQPNRMNKYDEIIIIENIIDNIMVRRFYKMYTRSSISNCKTTNCYTVNIKRNIDYIFT